MIDLFSRIDLLIVGVATAATGLLGFVIFFNNRRSVTSRIFLLFSLVTVVWGIINYSIYGIDSGPLSLWLIRFLMASAVWQAFFFYQLFKVFPEENYVFSKKHKFLLLPVVVATSLITLTPLFFPYIIHYSPGQAPIVAKGPGLILFALLSVSLVVRGLFFLIKKTLSMPATKREPFVLIFIGTFITFTLIIGLNFILPSFFNNVDYIPLGALFTFPFILCTGYAIAKHKLLDIKILSTEVLSFSVVILSFVEALLAKNNTELIFRSFIFISLFVFSVLLTKSVIKEVKQREQLELLSRKLQVANARLKELDQQKTEFLSIASHQLRTPLSIIKGYIELIEDGAYGTATKKMAGVLCNMNESNERLVKLVDEFLDITRIEQGSTKFNFAAHDINLIIEDVLKEITERVHSKGLEIEWKKTKRRDVSMDDEKIRHVVFNFIDNAIKYSEKGAITISATVDADRLTVTVKDSGIGFSPVDKANFFQKFFRGENTKTTNVNGTGLGLYVCRKFIEAHNGGVAAHSVGLGQGSEFSFWIPTRQNS